MYEICHVLYWGEPQLSETAGHIAVYLEEMQRQEGRLTPPRQASGLVDCCPGTGTCADCAGERGGRAPSDRHLQAGAPEAPQTLSHQERPLPSCRGPGNQSQRRWNPP